MNEEIQKLYKVWMDSKNRALTITELPQISFDDLTNAIISTGPFYFYIIDFYDMALSHVSPSIQDIQGFDPESVVFNDILDSIHPEDVDFVAKTEAAVGNFFYKNIGREKLLTYKMSYCFRARMKDGNYALINHQALMITLDDRGGYGKSLNIHTRIDHLSTVNTYKFSLIGLNGEPSYMNLSAGNYSVNNTKFSKREIDVVKLIANGLNNNEIADALFISPLTVKKHRTNIMSKCDCKNTAQLIKTCVLQGLIGFFLVVNPMVYIDLRYLTCMWEIDIGYL